MLPQSFINVKKTAKEANNDQLSQQKKIYAFKNLIEIQFLKVHKETLKPSHKDTVFYSLQAVLHFIFLTIQLHKQGIILACLELPSDIRGMDMSHIPNPLPHILSLFSLSHITY